MDKNSLVFKVFLGYFVAVSMLAIVVVFTLIKTVEVKRSSDSISQHQVPALATSLSLLSEINHSLSALKGWVSIGEEKQKTERDLAWKNINKSFNTLRAIAREQQDNRLGEDLERFKKSLDKLHDQQQKIELIAHTTDNTPGLKILTEDASPKADVILDSIDSLIDLEYQGQWSAERKEIFYRLNEFRFSMDSCMASIRTYLISNNDKHLQEFNISWEKNEKDLNYLQEHAHLFTAKQQQLFEVLVNARENFILYPDQMFDYRQGSEWDTAKLLMDKWIGPLETRINGEMENIIDSYSGEMKRGFLSISDDFNSLIYISTILLLLSIVICSLLAKFITRLVVGPIEQVVNAANSITQGDFDVDMEIKGSYEAESLRDSLLDMTQFLKRIANHARLVASGNFDEPFSPQGVKDTLGEALQKMTVNLKAARTESDVLHWVNTGQARLSEELRGLSRVEDIVTVSLSFISKYIYSSSSAFYLLENDFFVKRASYIQYEEDENEERFKLGSGMIGQAALDQVIMTHETKAEQSFMKCAFGIGESVPKTIVCVPLLIDSGNSRLSIGVIVFGLDNVIDEKLLELLKKSSDYLSSAIEMASSRSKLQQLLEESQAQAEELQSQQEELRVVNEELESKARALQSSEEELKSQSEDLRNSNQALEQQKEAIERKSSELETTSKYKSEFMANMSHELRTPLNSLLILSESLSKNHDKNLTQEQIDDARIIFDAGSSLLELINDILDLSKVDAGKLKLYFEEVDIKKLIENINSQFKSVSATANIRFTINIPDDNLLLYTDAMRLEQILRNLLSNAFKFTPKGEVILSVFVKNDNSAASNSNVDNSKCMVFSVKDTGVGIKKDKQQTIFEAFQQEDGSTCRVYGGTGLGLTISKELARMLDGAISLSSEEGKGSEFTLCLPVRNDSTVCNVDDNFEKKGSNVVSLRSAQNSCRYLSETRSIVDDRKTLSVGEKSILIVEDDLVFAKKLLEISRNKGFKCIQVSTGEQALSLANQFLPSAVILDLGLPDMSGMEVLDALKNNSKLGNVPIHIISGQDEDCAMLNDGYVGFLTKPVLLQDVDQVLNKFETLINKPIKRILLMDTLLELKNDVENMLKGRGIEINLVENTFDALSGISESSYDCCILKLSDKGDDGYWTLDNIVIDNDDFPPVIIYTNNSLSEEKYQEIQKLTDRVVVKGKKSFDRLKNELECFLYSVEQLNPIKEHIKNNEIPPHCLEGKKILLVDDDLRNTYALSKELKRYGAHIHLADNGELAIEKVKKNRNIDVILMDIMMPIMNGYDTIKMIRSCYSTKIPIIALTAKAMSNDQDKCFEAGANDYMSKPVKVDELVTMVKMWVSG